MKTSMKIRGRAAAALLAAALTVGAQTGPPGSPAPTPTPAPPECEGAACPSVTLTWEEEGQRFRADNSSAQRVRVTVTTFAGDSWVVVEPQASGFLGVKSFNGAYRAEFE